MPLLRILLAATHVSLIAGCGDNLPGPATSGSRLAFQKFVYEGGAVQLDRTVLHDLERSEECSPQRWADGARYCTPAAGEMVYVDDQCLTEVARVPQGTTIRYAATLWNDVLIASLRPLGNPLGGVPPRATWKLDHGLCVLKQESGAGSYFQVGEEITSDAFVRIERTAPFGTSRLQLVQDTSADGMVLPVAFHDQQLGLECAPQARPDAATSDCHPIAAELATYSADAACTVPVAAISPSIPTDAIEAVIDGCARYFAIGNEIDSTMLWAARGCFAVVAPPDRRYFEAANELALPRIPRIISDGDRVRLITLGDEELHFVDTLVHDEQLGVDCVPTMRDVLRCMPPVIPPGYVVPNFTDSQCTISIDIAWLPSDCNASSASYTTGANGFWRHIAGPHLAPLYTRQLDGNCQLAPLVQGRLPHAVGYQLPDDMFPTVSAHTP
ncbi:MAG: hypothetical protein JWO36_6356 [Myxococcales bacterium]|nr:hypothetical protein [Myxococcales bacterium]